MFAMPRIHCHGYMTKPAKHGASGVCWLTTFRQGPLPLLPSIPPLVLLPTLSSSALVPTPLSLL